MSTMMSDKIESDMALLVDKMVIDDDDASSCALSTSSIHATIEKSKSAAAEKHSAGLCIRAFNEGKSQLFTVPSQTVEVTQGSLNFVEDYKINGPFSKNRFHVCTDFMEGVCRKGRQCSGLHIPTDSRSSEIHANRSPPETYDRLREGYMLTVLDTVTKLPNNYTSESLFFTRGAAQYLDQWDESGAVPPQKLHRCIHYEQSKICHFGKLCNFVHAAGPPTNNKDVDPQRKQALAAPTKQHAAPPPPYFQQPTQVLVQQQAFPQSMFPQQQIATQPAQGRQQSRQQQQIPTQTIIHQVPQQHQVVVLQQSPTGYLHGGQTQYIVQQSPSQFYPQQVIYTTSTQSPIQPQQQFPHQQIVVVRQDGMMPASNEKHIIYTTAVPQTIRLSN